MGGSLAAVNLPGNVSGNSYDAGNEQTGFNGTTLSYDANGNLTADGTLSYIWGNRNQLNQIKQGSTVVASMSYDGLGRRQARATTTGATQYLYDGLNPVQELNTANPPAPTATLLNGLGLDERFALKDVGGNVSSLLSNALGSTIGLVNSGGALATSYTYQPFGATTVGGAASVNSYQFTGRENDATGLYFYRARYYSPTFQRFIAQDPMSFGGGPNLYGYVLNNPISFIDPFGYQWLPTPTPSPTPSLDQVLQDAGNPLNLFGPNTPTGEPAMSCAPPPPPPPQACPGGNLGVISDLDLVEAATVGGVAAGVYIGGLWGGVAGGLLGFGIGNVDLIGRTGCP